VRDFRLDTENDCGKDKAADGEIYVDATGTTLLQVIEPYLLRNSVCLDDVDGMCVDD
jgi:hypothetical protein